MCVMGRNILHDDLVFEAVTYRRYVGAELGSIGTKLKAVRWRIQLTEEEHQKAISTYIEGF